MTAAAEGMAKVLDEHVGYASERYSHGIHYVMVCGCGWEQPDEGSNDADHGAHRAHVTDALAAAGYGLLADAWDEGRRAGVNSESIYGGLDDSDQDNPYRSQP